MKRVVVDMDGVLVDLLPAWLHVYGTHTGEWLHPDKITEYGHERFVSDKDAFWASLQRALEIATPMPGSSVFAELCVSYKVTVATYCHPAAPNAQRLKVEWMRRYFPEFDIANMRFVQNKATVAGDFIIEDSQENVLKWEAAHPNGMGFLMKAPYNHFLTVSWDDIRAELLEGGLG